MRPQRHDDVPRKAPPRPRPNPARGNGARLEQDDDFTRIAPPRPNRTFDDVIDELQAKNKEHKVTTKKLRTEEFSIAASILELYAMIRDRKEDQAFRTKLAKEGIKLHAGSHLLIGLVRRYVSDNSNTGNLWSEAILYGLDQGIEHYGLADFLKDEGGLRACADKFRDKDGQSKRQPPRPQNANPTRSKAIRLKPLNAHAHFSKKFIDAFTKLTVKGLPQRIGINAELAEGLITFDTVTIRHR